MRAKEIVIMIIGSQHCIHVNKSVSVNTIKKCVKKISFDECSVSVALCVLLCLKTIVDIKQLDLLTLF